MSQTVADSSLILHPSSFPGASVLVCGRQVLGPPGPGRAAGKPRPGWDGHGPRRADCRIPQFDSAPRSGVQERAIQAPGPGREYRTRMQRCPSFSTLWDCSLAGKTNQGGHGAGAGWTVGARNPRILGLRHPQEPRQLHGSAPCSVPPWETIPAATGGPRGQTRRSLALAGARSCCRRRRRVLAVLLIRQVLLRRVCCGEDSGPRHSADRRSPVPGRQKETFGRGRWHGRETVTQRDRAKRAVPHGGRQPRHRAQIVCPPPGRELPGPPRRR